MSIGKNAWKCFGRCDAGGNILDFVALTEDLSVRKAAVTIADWFGIDAAAYERPAERTMARRAAMSSTGEPVTEHDSDRSEETAGPELKRNPALRFELKNLDPEHQTNTALGARPDTLAVFGGAFVAPA